MQLTMRSLAIALAVIASIAVFGPSANSATGGKDDPISRLKGYWKGDGSVTPASGPSQPFECIVTYRHSKDRTKLKQNLSCKNASYKLRAATLLEIDNGVVSGRWEDKTNSLSGDVAGTVTDDGFDVKLRGRFFEAQMQVVGSACEQSVIVTPKRKNYIRALSALLRRC